MYKRGSPHQSTHNKRPLRQTLLSAALLLGAAVFFLALLSPAPTEPDVRQVGAAPPEDFTYTISGDTITITGYNGEGGDVEIPAEIDGASVTSIGQYAFSGCSGLTGVTISDGVTGIGESAFSGCSGLAGNLTIPASVTGIGPYAFFGCSGLTAVTIPGSVADIGESAFSGCSGLTGVTISDGVTGIGERAFSGCSGLTGNLTIPASVTGIGQYAFFGCSGLTGVTIPGSVTDIGSNAFSNCSGLTAVTIPDGVTGIGERAFYGCSGLTGNLTIPASVTGIGKEAFLGCSNLTGALIIPYGVTTIGGGAFSGCSGLTGDLIIPGSVTSIGDSAFSACSGLTGVTIPDGVTSIGGGAFSDCYGLTGDLIIPDSVTGMGDQVFFQCYRLTNITIPGSVAGIGNEVFSGCSGLTGVTISDGVTSIGLYAFSGCSNLSSVTIPAGLTGIGEGAFYQCSSLSEIIISHGATRLPLYFLTETTLASKVDLYAPMSVIGVGGEPYFSTYLPGGTALADNTTIYGVKESFIVDWAGANKVQCVEIDGTITRREYNAWRLVPYQEIIKTVMPDNIALEFNIIGGTLPAGLFLMQKGEFYDGLEMLSGQFYGAPLDNGAFQVEIEVRSYPHNYLLDLQTLTVTVKEADDAGLTATNDYPVTTTIGLPAVPGTHGDYIVTALADQIFTAADTGTDTNGDGVIDERDNNFYYFERFWLDGEILAQIYYDADSGSTVVTLFAQLLPSLDKNGAHTAAAEFSINGVQQVSAQRFTVDLPEPVPSDPEGSDPDEPNDPEQPTAPAQPGGEGDEGGSIIVSAGQQGEPAPEAGAETISPPAETTPPPPPPPTPTTPPETAAPAAVIAPPAAPDLFVPPVVPEGGTGEYEISYDGSGPLEVRIDIPLEEFRELYCDEALWAPGADYAVRSGSTILTVPAERLAEMEGGRHVLSAVFAAQTVDIAFTLAGTPESGTGMVVPPAIPAVPPADAPPFAPFFAAVLAVWGTAVLAGLRLSARQSGYSTTA
ncbi:MAG: leucine-rich repeat protein [Gracilibacteraceae bacterium]|jgi:hypothetical protein|nr:leucine-rich repeat protein [Gracilibacteraceae bacterium]